MRRTNCNFRFPIYSGFEASWWQKYDRSNKCIVEWVKWQNCGIGWLVELWNGDNEACGLLSIATDCLWRIELFQCAKLSAATTTTASATAVRITSRMPDAHLPISASYCIRQHIRRSWCRLVPRTGTFCSIFVFYPFVFAHSRISCDWRKCCCIFDRWEVESNRIE